MNIIYCRTAQKHQAAIDVKQYKCRKFLESKHMTVDKIYIDDGFSGYIMDRPGLNQIINNLDTIKSITVSSVDRIYRNSNKLLELYKLLKDKNIKLYDTILGIDVINSLELNAVKVIDELLNFQGSN
ncbi:MAG: hypothetical protein APF76_04530 [Desulfitibacter sp. BRH_c19]|nr:MAG: hypothetical protein APF76_04530 [Desulfitibacter sp. BRH_c19]